MFTDMTFVDWLGVLGSFVIAGAYLSVSRGWVVPDRPPYHLINLMGAVMILSSLYYRPNAGAILIEVLWIAIALWGLVGYLLQRHRD